MVMEYAQGEPQISDNEILAHILLSQKANLQ